jgi:hypothetical protein
MELNSFRKQFVDAADACALAQAIVDTVREPVLVLDKTLRVIAASRSFYSLFQVAPGDTQGRLLYELGDGQWDIPKLRLLLEKIIPEHGVMEDYEVEEEFPDAGRRTICLNAREVFYQGGAEPTILLGMQDVTRQSALEREKEALLRQKDVLLEELQHRVVNSLQIIAGIILMKARAVKSEETRLHLQDTHSRVMSIAALQAHLHSHGAGGPIDVGPYLAKLCGCPRNVDDRRYPAHLSEAPRRRGKYHVPSGGVPRLDRHRACDECSQAWVSRREKRCPNNRRL